MFSYFSYFIPWNSYSRSNLLVFSFLWLRSKFSFDFTIISLTFVIISFSLNAWIICCWSLLSRWFSIHNISSWPHMKKLLFAFLFTLYLKNMTLLHIRSVYWRSGPLLIVILTWIHYTTDRFHGNIGWVCVLNIMDR